jgi:hypothetical protein
MYGFAHLAILLILLTVLCALSVLFFVNLVNILTLQVWASSLAARIYTLLTLHQPFSMPQYVSL